MKIDLWALAKGYFVGQLKQFSQNEGVQSGLVDLGGSMLTIGEQLKRDDGYWRVRIQKPSPIRGDLAGVVLVKDKSLAPQVFMNDRFRLMGKNNHHIFDSRAGYPIENRIGQRDHSFRQIH